MTMIRGVRLLAVPCCGARYSAPRYLSMNFSAWAYWTDGWRDSSLMPNDSGLRHCSCRQFILMKDLVELGTADDSELPQIDRVPEEQLSECIKAVTNSAVAIAARLDYWRHLNHPYRIKYCAHRDAEEAATEAAWRAANPERKLPAGVSKRWARKAPQYVRPPNSPFTYPAFEPTAEQLENMAQLTVLLQAAKTNALPWGQELALAELLREQSRFDEARASLAALSNARRIRLQDHRQHDRSARACSDAVSGVRRVERHVSSMPLHSSKGCGPPVADYRLTPAAELAAINPLQGG